MKKTLSIIMVVFICCSLFCGCGSKISKSTAKIKAQAELSQTISSIISNGTYSSKGEESISLVDEDDKNYYFHTSTVIIYKNQVPMTEITTTIKVSKKTGETTITDLNHNDYSYN